ncbi:MAG TPA: nuclear transport factor 2 family protein [Nocardioides sp.]|jgi:hypothetical protein|nr:nuclear transport factor 2 family protein [Nocardioides sp.]
MTVSGTVADQLAEAHQQVLDALVDGDRTTLGHLVPDDCRIVGPKGYLIDKQEWIEAHDSGVYEQVMLRVEHTELTVRDDLAVRCDLQRSECLFRGETITGLFRVLNVWARDHDAWQLVGIQYTAVAPEAA